MPHNLNIVLMEPKIPVNTGSIGRLCLATQSTLHLIEPLGFEINDRQLKRAGLDYWKFVQVQIHKNLETFFKSIPDESPKVFFSTKAQASYFEHQFEAGSYLFFGSETEGISEKLRNTWAHSLYRIPQYDDRVRSLNLANAVSIVVYEAIRQLGP
ncbi:MAG: tRNA (uridine(34)/cytosine(34)/5-carboxymethylaminomethyluridine(34)-2'-O)-methyltransferase TrmL [Nitrospinaceae bacterium]|nr:MAG: tRNA (uridine(34)/cytosine(34)/5-carboxymethylaminomethyluridine(34)-2'-O)-methyltransferase TrmL [Nitrospinaceae bacterium]